MSWIVGKPAPTFSMEVVDNGQFKKVGLDDYKGRWLVLFFYPLDFTFVCPTEILAFSDRLDDFNKVEADVLGVSVDSKFSHLAWTQRPRAQGGIEGLRYPIAGDLNKQVAADFGVLTDGGVALRGLFLIDPDGIVQHATVNNLAVGRSVDEALRVLEAFRFVRQHGEVCPADWKPGSDAMTPDPEGSKTWFSKHGKG